MDEDLEDLLNDPELYAQLFARGDDVDWLPGLQDHSAACDEAAQGGLPSEAGEHADANCTQSWLPGGPLPGGTGVHGHPLQPLPHLLQLPLPQPPSAAPPLPQALSQPARPPSLPSQAGTHALNERSETGRKAAALLAHEDALAIVDSTTGAHYWVSAARLRGFPTAPIIPVASGAAAAGPTAAGVGGGGEAAGGSTPVVSAMPSAHLQQRWEQPSLGAAAGDAGAGSGALSGVNAVSAAGGSTGGGSDVEFVGPFDLRLCGTSHFLNNSGGWKGCVARPLPQHMQRRRPGAASPTPGTPPGAPAAAATAAGPAAAAASSAAARGGLYLVSQQYFTHCLRHHDMSRCCRCGKDHAVCCRCGRPRPPRETARRPTGSGSAEHCACGDTFQHRPGVHSVYKSFLAELDPGSNPGSAGSSSKPVRGKGGPKRKDSWQTGTFAVAAAAPQAAEVAAAAGEVAGMSPEAVDASGTAGSISRKVQLRWCSWWPAWYTAKPPTAPRAAAAAAARPSTNDAGAAAAAAVVPATNALLGTASATAAGPLTQHFAAATLAAAPFVAPPLLSAQGISAHGARRVDNQAAGFDPWQQPVENVPAGIAAAGWPSADLPGAPLGASPGEQAGAGGGGGGGGGGLTLWQDALQPLLPVPADMQQPAMGQHPPALQGIPRNETSEAPLNVQLLERQPQTPEGWWFAGIPALAAPPVPPYGAGHPVAQQPLHLQPQETAARPAPPPLRSAAGGERFWDSSSGQARASAGVAGAGTSAPAPRALPHTPVSPAAAADDTSGTSRGPGGYPAAAAASGIAPSRSPADAPLAGAAVTPRVCGRRSRAGGDTGGARARLAPISTDAASSGGSSSDSRGASAGRRRRQRHRTGPPAAEPPPSPAAAAAAILPVGAAAGPAAAGGAAFGPAPTPAQQRERVAALARVLRLYLQESDCGPELLRTFLKGMGGVRDLLALPQHHWAGYGLLCMLLSEAARLREVAIRDSDPATWARIPIRLLAALELVWEEVGQLAAQSGPGGVDADTARRALLVSARRELGGMTPVHLCASLALNRALQWLLDRGGAELLQAKDACHRTPYVIACTSMNKAGAVICLRRAWRLGLFDGTTEAHKQAVREDLGGWYLKSIFLASLDEVWPDGDLPPALQGIVEYVEQFSTSNGIELQSGRILNASPQAPRPHETRRPWQQRLGLACLVVCGLCGALHRLLHRHRARDRPRDRPLCLLRTAIPVPSAGSSLASGP